ncbi:Uncharacterised protein [Acinetobacter calcoaceticus]|uniref:HipA-like C-terminal domain-containing protein n=2 Tax=Acinetobacter calcoaceticus TaxID=471 RepID=A0A446ZIP9_ACICA|nr:Uncharacterised protein [Acinetobacter calcoaceticus]
MEEKYNIVDISNIDQDNIEYLGTKDKFWYVKDDEEYLFKSIQVTKKDGQQHLRIGEDCSEKIACEIGGLLGIPHVHYELAIYKGLRGVVSKNFISQNRGESLVLGNELLERFKISDSMDLVHQTIPRVYIVIRFLIGKKPLGFNELPNIKTAGEFFVGYLMLDALIANQDRHNENWGMIQRVNGDRHLALTFDHGASLGKNINDEKKEERLKTKDQGNSVKAYTKRAKSWFYLKQDRNTRLKVIEAFQEFGKLYPAAYHAWVTRLIEINEGQFKNIIDKIPDHLMSDVSKRFALEMIKCNKDTIIANSKLND